MPFNQFNQLRANIRNAMVPMTCAEARDYASSFEDAESRKYAEEFAREREEEGDRLRDLL